MEFDPSFFVGEVRSDFYVKPMIKKAWAAGLEVLSEIDRICQKHNIKYFAEWGTMLGAVRHNGFIPWDDDIDIGMLRPDYERFIKVARTELPKEFVVTDPRNTPNAISLITNISNSSYINTSTEHMEKFHGFPYIVGVDIFVTDFLPSDEQERKNHIALFTIAYRLFQEWDSDSSEEFNSMEEKISMLHTLEELTGIHFTLDNTIRHQLLRLADQISAMYMDINPEYLSLMIKVANWNNYMFPASCYNGLTIMPFENTQIPVVNGYHEILSKRYPGNYMIPKIHYTHDYPFYKKQYFQMLDDMTAQGLTLPLEYRESFERP